MNLATARIPLDAVVSTKGTGPRARNRPAGKVGWGVGERTMEEGGSASCACDTNMVICASSYSLLLKPDITLAASPTTTHCTVRTKKLKASRTLNCTERNSVMVP